MVIPGYCVDRERCAHPPAPFFAKIQFLFAARRFNEAASLGVRAEQLGMPHISEAIINAINSDRAPSTIKAYTSEVERFKIWKNSPYMRSIPMPQARNLFLAKCSAEGRLSSMPTVVAALNYFCGPLTGVDKEIQDSLLQAVKAPVHPRVSIVLRFSPVTWHGISTKDPKVTQAAALALIQFKGLLRISEAQNLRRSQVKPNGNGEWVVHISRSKTDQCSKGAVVAFRFNAMEEALWNKYTATLGGASFLFQSGSTGLPLAISTLRDRLMLLIKGGAATQALNMGAHQIDVMQAGRWRTLGGFQNYIAPNALPSSLPLYKLFMTLCNVPNSLHNRCSILTL
ncbi:site-specific recombinase, phage integrase family [Cooperia oncophora]